MIKIILFDFDGTIADSFENFLEIVNLLSDKYHLDKIPPDQINALRTEDIKTLIKKLKVPIFKIPFLAHDMKKMQREQMKSIKPIKDIPEILHELKKMDYKLSILTSNGRENVLDFLKLNNIDVFDFIYDNVSIFGKDRAINKFIANNKINKNELIYVGDEIRDILACQRAVVKIISVAWGFNSKEGLEKYKPDFLIEDPKELLIKLKLLNS